MTTHTKDRDKRLRYWVLSVDYPTSYSSRNLPDTWQKTARMGVVAQSVDDAIAEIRKLKPDCTVWSVSHQGTVDNLEIPR